MMQCAHVYALHCTLQMGSVASADSASWTALLEDRLHGDGDRTTVSNVYRPSAGRRTTSFIVRCV